MTKTFQLGGLVPHGLVLATLALLVAHAVALDAEAAAPVAAHPFAASRLDAAERYAIEGDIVERRDAGSYLYLAVREASGAIHWVATIASLAPTHGRVSVWVVGRAHGFVSRRLGERFETLLFGVVRGVDRSEGGS